MVIKWFLLVALLFANGSSQRKRETTYYPEIIDQESTFKVTLNETICLPCKVKKQYTDKCFFYWKKDGSVVLQWPRYRMKSNKCLRIRNIRSSDHAKFECHAKCVNGHVAEAVRNLVVINRDINATYQPEREPSTKFVPSVPVPIFFRDTLERTNAKLVRKFFYIGRRAKLKCAISGSPAPKIQWYFNGVLLAGSNLVNIRPRTYALVINPFSSHHIGNYTCVGSNGRGVLNMSFVVANKSGDPHPPKPEEEEKIVTEGDNVTLRCKKPANKVRYLVWHPPKRELQKQQNQALPRDYEPFYYKSRKVPKSVSDDGLTVKDFYLYNISQKVHQGVYRCLALYKRSRSDKLVPIKIINLKIKTDSQVSVVGNGRPNSEILLVKIAVPVMGSLLTLVVVILCFRCSRKTTVNNPAKTKTEEEENTLSMHILPNTPTGTLRIHKALQEFALGNEMKSINEAEPPPDDEYDEVGGDTIDNKLGITLKSATKSTSLINQNNIPQNDSINTITDSNHRHRSSTESLETPCTPPPPYPYDDGEVVEQINSIASSNNTETTTTINKKQRHNNNNKRYHNQLRSKQHDTAKTIDCENKISLYNSNSNSCSNNSTIQTNLTESDIPEESEEDDQLLQREMKNWEPLIRDSTSYISDRSIPVVVNNDDDDTLRYNRTSTTLPETKTLLLGQEQLQQQLCENSILLASSEHAQQQITI